MENLIEPREQSRLQALSSFQILDSPPEPAFDDLTALAADICETPISVISFLDSEREWYKSKIGLPFPEVSRDSAFCSYALRGSGVMVIPDVTQDIRFKNHPMVLGAPHIRFFAASPILSPDGHGLGALCVLDRVPHEKLSPRQSQLLHRLAHEAGMLLELRRQNILQKRENELQQAELKRLQEDLIVEEAEHQRAEEDLHRRERQLADAQRLALLGSWEWDLKNDRVTWSDELYRVFGLRPGERPSTYEAYLNYIHPDDREQIDRLIKTTLRSRGSFRGEKRIVRSDGTIRILYSSGEVILDEDGRPDRMVGFAQDITLRKEMENRLQESVSLLNSTLESTTDGILVVRLDGHITSYNQKFVKMWEIPEEILAQRRCTAVLEHALTKLKDPGRFKEGVDELHVNPEVDNEDTMVLKDGRIFERYSRPQIARDRIVGRVWSFRDVTAHRRATEILTQSEERYRSLVTAISQVVWLAGPDGTVTSDNQAWRDYTGQTHEQMMGEGWVQKVHPEDRQQVLALWRTAVRSSTFYQSEFRLQRRDGEWREVLTRGVPMFNKDGSVREWVGVCHDITERRKAQRSILDERDFSNALINSLPGTFYVVDQTGLLVKWNKNLETVTGYSAEELSGMKIDAFVPPDEVSRVWSEFGRAMTEGEIRTELTLVVKNGRKIPYYCTGRMVILKGELRMVGVGMDISKEKEVEEEIRRLNRELENRVEDRTRQLDSSNKDLQSFSYTISHDLKAPLRAITGFAEAIREDCAQDLDEEHQMYLERILQSTNRMTQLIEDLLTYSRIGRSAIHLHPVPLKQVVMPIVEETQFLLSKMGGSIRVTNQLPIVMADRSLLTQAISNLIENAIKYRKPEIPLEIGIGHRKEDNLVTLCISDNGIGIAPDHHKRIFEVFQRLHGNHDYPGTGIGLANVRKAVELQEGTVWVESELGKGSTFCLQLKAPDAPPPGAAK